MQTILGAGGAIGAELVRELDGTGQQVRLVGRIPKLIQGATESDSELTAHLANFLSAHSLA